MATSPQPEKLKRSRGLVERSPTKEKNLSASARPNVPLNCLCLAGSTNGEWVIAGARMESASRSRAMTSFEVSSEHLAAFLPHGPLADIARRFGCDPPRQLYVVVDANILIREALFVPQKAGAKTQLCECIEAGVIIAIAPREAIAEVETHLPGVASRKGRQDEALRVWREQVMPRTHFYDVDATVAVPEWASALGGRDPKDLPYARLLAQTKADAILTRDRDLLDQPGPVRDDQVLRVIRDHARGEAVCLTVELGGRVTISVTAGAVVELAELLANVPWWVWAILGLGAGAFLTLPIFAKPRAWIVRAFEWCCATFPDAVRFYIDKRAVAQALRGAVARAMPTSPKVKRLVDFAFRVLLAARAPMAPSALALEVRNAGWKGPEKMLPANLGRLLRRDRRFVRTRAGEWMARGRAA